MQQTSVDTYITDAKPTGENIGAYLSHWLQQLATTNVDISGVDTLLCYTETPNPSAKSMLVHIGNFVFDLSRVVAVYPLNKHNDKSLYIVHVETIGGPNLMIDIDKPTYDELAAQIDFLSNAQKIELSKSKIYKQPFMPMR